MADPTCEVKDGAGPYVTTTGGVNITPGSPIVIRLVSSGDVDSWAITCLTTDDLSSADDINAGLVIDPVAKTASFTAPGAGAALRFQSQVNAGYNRNNVRQSSYTTTFVLYTLTVNGTRVHALDETTEGNALGWGAGINAMLRAIASGGGGGTDGKAIRAMANTDQTLAPEDVSKAIIEATGAMTAPRRMVFPAPAGATTSYHRAIHHSGTGANIIVATSAARTIAIPPGCTAIVEFDEHGARELAAKDYDPREHGCLWDGTSDNLPGFEAMLQAIPLEQTAPVVIKVPRGVGYFSDNLRLTRTLIVVGPETGINDAIGTPASGMKFAPLKGIILESYYTQANYPAGKGADGTVLRNLAIFSTQAIPTNPVMGHGRALKMLDTTLDVRVAGVTYAKGVCVLATGTSSPAGANADAYAEGATRGGPTVWFRVTVGGTTVGAQPAAFATATVADIGDTITDGDLTWIVESIPKDYLNATDYVVGQRTFLPGDTQCYFEAIVAGTSIAAGVKNGAANGIGVTCPARMLSPTYGEEFLDNPAVPGGLKWRAYFPSGVNVLAPNCTLDISIAGFTGYGVCVNSALDATAYPASGGYGFADFAFTKNLIISMCGGGIRYNGSDGGGGKNENGNYFYMGMGRTNVDAAAYLNKATPTWGTGAAAIFDRSLGGNHHPKHYMQFGAAIPFRNDTLAGSGSPSYFQRCTAETYEGSLILFPGRADDVTPMSPASDGIITGAEGRGFREVDNTGAVTTYARLSNTTGGLFAFRSTPDSVNEWGWKYGADGYWRMNYSGQNANAAFALASFGAGSNPGNGWMLLERGHLVGAVASALYRGPLNEGGDVTGGLTNRYLRAGLRRTGDRFESASKVVTVTSDGYRGRAWQALQTVSAGYEPWAIPPYIVEPTANGSWPAAGLQVWKCTTDGTTGATEPAWPASPVAGVTTVTDGTVVWTYLGVTPSMVVAQTLVRGGVQTLAMGDANKTLTAAQSAAETLRPTGALTANRTITYPAAVDAAGYTRTINNTCTGAFSVIVGDGGAGTTVTVANGTSARVLFDSRGATDFTGASGGGAATSVAGSGGNANITCAQTTWGSTSPEVGLVTTTPVATTDATLTTVLTFPIAADTLVDFVISVQSRRTGGASGTAGDTYRADFPVSYQRIGSAAPTLVGAAAVESNKKSNGGGSAYAASIAISGNNLLVQFTGVAATNISTRATIVADEV